MEEEGGTKDSSTSSNTRRPSQVTSPAIDSSSLGARRAVLYSLSKVKVPLDHHVLRIATVPKWARLKAHILLDISSLGFRLITSRKRATPG